MNIQLGSPYRLKVQINTDLGNPVTGGTYAVILKRDSDTQYWDGASWGGTLVSGITLSHDVDGYGSWYATIPGTAFTEEGQYTAIFDSLTPNITDSFDLNVIRMAEQWSATAE